MNIDHFETCIRTVPAGGVTSPKGFKAAGIHAGFRKNPQRLDMACVTADKLASCAGVFTTNRFCAAPVQVSRQNLGGAEKGYGLVKGIVINSGNANAATGEQGRAVAAETCEIASQILGCEREQVLVASTGVIGQTLGIELFETGLPAAIDALSVSGGADAARAIMTTDTHSKEYAISYTSQTLQYADCTFTVGGMCKGSGMIMPNMATMIAVITTDAPVEPRVLHSILKQTVDVTFNRGRQRCLQRVALCRARGVRDARPHHRVRRRGRVATGDRQRDRRRNGRGCRHGGARRGQLAAGQDRHRRP